LVHEKELNDLSFSRDGSRVLTASQDGTARWWNTLNGKEMARLSHEIPQLKFARLLGYGSVWKATVNSDGTRIATIPAGKNIAVIWDAESASELYRVVHSDQIYDVAFSPDGKYLATGGKDGTLRLWNATTGNEIKHFNYDGTVDRVVFSPDGRFLASTARLSKNAFGWSEIVVWDALTGRRMQQFGGHPGWYTDIAYSSDDHLLATSSSNGVATLWEGQSGREQVRLEHSGPVLSLAFTPDTKYLTTESRLTTVSPQQAQVWDWATEKNIGSLSEGGGVVFMIGSEDRNRVITRGIDDTVRIWDAETGRALYHFHFEAMHGFALDDDGKHIAVPEEADMTIHVRRLASDSVVARLTYEGKLHQFSLGPKAKLLAAVITSESENIWIWDVASETVMAKLSPCIDVPEGVTRMFGAKTPMVDSLAFSPSGTLLAAGGRFGGKVCVWNIERQELIGQVSSKVSPVSPVIFRFSPDGRRMVTIHGFDNVLRIWDIQSFEKPVFQIERGKSGAISALVFSPDSSRLAFAIWQSTQVWEIETQTLLFNFTHDEWSNDISFSADGRYLATAGADMAVRIWDLNSGIERLKLPHLSDVAKAHFSPSGRVLLTKERKHGIGIARGWDSGTGEELFRFSHGATIDGVVYNQNGSHVATKIGALVQVWHVQTAKKVAEFSHDAEVEIWALSADGSRLVTVPDRDGNYSSAIGHVWDVTAGKKLYPLTHEDSIWSVSFSADDTLIITGGNDHTARVWDALTGKQLARLDQGEVVKRVALSADNVYLAATTEIDARSQEDIHVWHLPTKRKVARLPHDGKRVAHLSFRPGNGILASADRGDTIRLWSLQSARIETMRLDHEGTVFDALINPDSKRASIISSAT
jgi:WD40 repeat protein